MRRTLAAQLSLFALMLVTFGCSGKPSESEVVAAVRNYYGSVHLVGGGHDYVTPAKLLDVHVVEIKDPERPCLGGPPRGPDEYPVVVHISGVCHIDFRCGPKEIDSQCKDGDPKRVDEQLRFYLLKDAADAAGQEQPYAGGADFGDARSNLGIRWVCD